jgi:hypothetical protein
MSECFNCQAKEVKTCNECGFDYCKTCWNDVCLHEPCSSTRVIIEPTNESIICFICPIQ